MSEQTDWPSFLQDVSTLVDEIQQRNVECIDSLLLLEERIQVSIQGLQTLSSAGICDDVATELCQLLMSLLHIVRTDIKSKEYSSVFLAWKSKTGKPGRPKFLILEDVLVHFRELGFNWKEVASLLNISRWTLMRRVDELGIKDRTGYTNLSDPELDQLLKNFRSLHGIAGGRSLALGYLRSLNIRVQQKRVTESLVRIDPSNSRLRWAAVIKRRTYSVPAANCLWHIDGNHSLVNWGFVLHGCIDGYSRMIMYLECATNNMATTVRDLFDRSIVLNGCPSRVRTDKGGENILVWERMVELRGPNRGSYIAGTSVHNQRIERLWRDVWAYVTSQFYFTFQTMEIQGLLNMSDERHVFILHYIFLRRINKVIEHFFNGWNNHPLRSEKNWSPAKLWNHSIFDKRNKNRIQIEELYTDGSPISNDYEWYGVDYNAPSPDDDGLSTVEVNNITCPFDNNTLQRILTVDPSQESNNFGVDIYMSAVALL